MTDKGLYEFLCVAIGLLVGGWLLALAVRRLRRGREDFALDVPIATAFAVRLLAAIGLGQLSAAQSLRGGDELTFMARAEDVAAVPISHAASVDKLTSELHTFIFSLNYRVFDPLPPDLLLRVEMVTFATLGVALLAAAVYELAGRRAGLIAAWILALEPANIFFSSLIHKEAIMYLAEGLVVYGGAMLWKRGKVTALVPMVVGCLLAIASRPYAGWFLAVAAAGLVLHAALSRKHGLRSFALASFMLILIAAFVPFALDATSRDKLKDLQVSQDANASDTEANLSLERVNYSTRGNVVLNLPKRIRDVIFRPYPWQTENLSQQFGLLGTLVVLAALALLAAAIARNRTTIMQKAAPLVYPAAFMLIAYAISAGNAGTAFRYRTHIVGLALSLVVVLFAARREEQPAPARRFRRSQIQPISGARTPA